VSGRVLRARLQVEKQQRRQMHRPRARNKGKHERKKTTDQFRCSPLRHPPRGLRDRARRALASHCTTACIPRQQQVCSIFNADHHARFVPHPRIRARSQLQPRARSQPQPRARSQPQPYARTQPQPRPRTRTRLRPRTQLTLKRMHDAHMTRTSKQPRPQQQHWRRQAKARSVQTTSPLQATLPSMRGRRSARATHHCALQTLRSPTAARGG
jgi:hypothetical protein